MSKRLSERRSWLLTTWSLMEYTCRPSVAPTRAEAIVGQSWKC
jgi:hypothetical protein